MARNLRRVWPDKVELSAGDDTRLSELAARHVEIAEQHNGSGDDRATTPRPKLYRIQAVLA